MKTVVVPNQEAKQVSQLRIEDLPIPEVKSDEVLVKIHAVGLNPVDFKLVAGHHPDWQYPHILGLDAAGEIVQIGNDVPTSFKIGQRVFYHGDLTSNGCFAEYAKTKYNCVAEIPEGVSYEAAASVLCNGMTAFAAINRKMNLAGKKTILIHAGAGGVGSIAIQLAKMNGLNVLTTVSTQKIAWAKKLGADNVIDYKTENVDQRVSEITDGVGVDVIVNTVGPDEAARDLQRLSYNGALITIVGQPPLDNYDLSAKGQSVMSVNLGGAHNGGNPSQLHDLSIMASELGKLIQNDKLKSVITKEIVFSDIPQGLQDLIDHKISGKIIAKL